MTINLKIPDIRELKPRITVFGVGGGGGNAVNNMIAAGLQGVDFVVANTDAQALTMSKAERIVQMGVQVTEGLGAGSQPEVGRAAAEEVLDEIRDHLSGAHMVFVTAGMGGGTGTGAAPVIAKAAKEMGILTVGVVTKPFHFEGERRMRYAEAGITDLQKHVDTLLIIPNQNLFRVANEKTTFADAFALADQVLYSGVACITDLMVKEGLINLDFADVRVVMREMGKAMMGTGEKSGDDRAVSAAEEAISNPLIDDSSMKGAKGVLISITGGKDLTLYEVDAAATRIRQEVDKDANIIVGATFDESLEGTIRVAVVATGIDKVAAVRPTPAVEQRPAPRAPETVARTNVPPSRIPAHAASAIAQAATAAVAAAVLPPSAIDDVTIRSMPPKPSLFMDPKMDAGRQDYSHHPVAPDMPNAFIPPQAERVPQRPRMPRIEDLPMPAQRQILQKRGELGDQQPDQQRKGLFQRIASGLTGRDSEPMHEPAPAIRPLPQGHGQGHGQAQGHGQNHGHAQGHGLPPRPASRPLEKREPMPNAGPRAPQGLDPHGRPAPVHNSGEDDQLEIPAFLRRQAN
jgi:cell division protein FtsZ